MAKVITAKQAAELINDDDVIVFAADGMAGYPNEIVEAARQRFIDEGHPTNITSVRGAGMGTFEENMLGEGAWCLDGMLSRSISSYLAVCPILARKVEENKVQAYMFPLGPILQLFIEVGRGMPGVMTKIGLGTFMDPRYGGGKCNSLTEKEGDNLVEYIPDFMGEEYLFYKSPGMDVALLRGTSADIHGNISIEKESVDLEMLSVAQAVKSSGGIVICQVEKLVDVYDIHARNVKVPAMYVDYIVVAEHPEDVPQNMGRRHSGDYNYSFTGDEIVDVKKSTDIMHLDHKKIIARRASMEIKEGDVVNFGIGMPQNVPTILEECGRGDMVMMMSETGVMGGIPAVGKDFGCHWNPEAFSDHGSHFAYFNGGNLDAGFFGLSEVDKKGNMNTSHLNGKISGIGGFTDISATSKKVVFMGTFTADGLKTEVKDGKLNIVQEGKYKKFIDKCEKVSFVAEEYLKNHESFLFITERCVIRCSKKGMVLEEVAPGIDINTQIIDQCDVELIIPEGGPKEMESCIFFEEGFRV
ncbi:MAG: acylcoa--acetate/3-ketoacidcoatransferase [Firmicutes bacterium]|nr:acylcoa--acetate/3-ketoacidcoatransferase [Bacillota bacterium]